MTYLRAGLVSESRGFSSIVRQRRASLGCSLADASSDQAVHSAPYVQYVESDRACCMVPTSGLRKQGLRKPPTGEQMPGAGLVPRLPDTQVLSSARWKCCLLARGPSAELERPLWYSGGGRKEWGGRRPAAGSVWFANPGTRQLHPALASLLSVEGREPASGVEVQPLEK